MSSRSVAICVSLLLVGAPGAGRARAEAGDAAIADGAASAPSSFPAPEPSPPEPTGAPAPSSAPTMVPRPNTSAPLSAEEGARPWALGVSPTRQAEALRIFSEGNERFLESRYSEAVPFYREALARWDHPAIRYNLGVALVQLDAPLAALEQLDAALRHGAAPHEPGVYQQALAYRKLLRGQLGELRVTCDQAEAEVTLDGRPLLSCPGAVTKLLVPGPHPLVASKAGHLTQASTLDVLPGRPLATHVRLVPITSLTRTERRWSPWRPWAVLGAGLAAAALVGLPLQLAARANAESYDRDVARLCPQGCAAATLPPEVVDRAGTARLEERVAIVAFGAGAVATLSGLTMVLLNAPRVVTPPPSGRRARLAPMIAPAAFGLALAVDAP